jgi:Bacterial membrane protein YfhO
MPQPLTWPNVSQTRFLATTPFTKILGATTDRYLTWAPPAAYYDKGYLFTQRPQDWSSLVMERGTLFGLHDTLGYNPVQLPRYWSYIRQIDPLPVFYNASVINDPSLQDLRVLGVRYLIVPTGVQPPVAGSVMATDGGYDLLEVPGWQPRVSVVPSWSVLTRAQALAAVTQPGFDPASSAVLETAPGVVAAGQGSRAGTATYSEADPEHVIIDADASAPSIVVVRTAYDPGWSATVDGHPAPVLPADSFLQGVPVSAGNHRIDLVYRDADVSNGMRLGIVMWLLLMCAIGEAVVIERRGRRSHGRVHQPV